MALFNIDSLVKLVTQTIPSDIKSLATNKVSKTDIIPTTNGGTNATTVEAARTNLEVYSKNEIGDISTANFVTTINNTYST